MAARKNYFSVSLSCTIVVFSWAQQVNDEPLTHSRNKESVVNPLPLLSNNPVKIATITDHVGYCEFFSYRTLLHQFLCKHNPETCTQPSVLELIHTGDGLAPNKNGDNRSHIFAAINERKFIFSEQCVPFAGFFPVIDMPSSINWNEANTAYLSKTYDNELQQSFDNEKKIFNRGYFKRNPLSPAQVVERLGSTLSTKLPPIMQEVIHYSMNQYIKSKDCEKISIPSFKADESRDVSPETLKQKLQVGHQVATQLLIPQPDGKAIGPHALVIANYKTECFSGFCTTRYQILDSLGLYWSKSRVDGWVSEEELFKYLHPQASMIWLSPT